MYVTGTRDTKGDEHLCERLLTLNDANRTYTCNFDEQAIPAKNCITTLRLYPVTHTDQTLAEWEATFDEAPGDEGKYERIVSREAFAANWANLAKIIAAKREPSHACGQCSSRSEDVEPSIASRDRRATRARWWPDQSDAQSFAASARMPAAKVSRPTACLISASSSGATSNSACHSTNVRSPSVTGVQRKVAT